MRDKDDSSATIISGYLTDDSGAGNSTDSTETVTASMAGDDSSKDHFVSDKQVRAGISTDETENVVAYHPAICQLDHHEEVHTSENTSSEMNKNDSDDSPSSSAASEVSSSEYCPTPMKRAKVSPVELGHRVFMCQTTQLDAFLNQINTTSLCYTPNCVGKLVPISIKHIGLGGSLLVKFSCTGCHERMLNLTSSIEIEFSRRTACSLAMQVAFIAAGGMHAQYSKVLIQNLGMSAVNSTTYYETIKLLDPIVSTLLSEVCTAAKDEMKALDPSTVGSWQRAITTSDGTWLTRGRFSQNCTFTVRNYVNNSLLYFVHLCMRGADKDKLYHGTAKGAEGYAASMAFKEAKEEEMHLKFSGKMAIPPQQNCFENITQMRSDPKLCCVVAI